MSMVASAAMPAVLIVLSVFLAIAATVTMCVLVMPKKKRGELNKFFAFLHDLFHFKFLIIEGILRVIYMFATFFCIIVGFFSIFTFIGGYGLLIMIVGPIVLRITYELIMMFVLLVKNVIELNAKTKNQNEGEVKSQFDATEEYIAKVIPVAPTCANCGAKLVNGSAFCSECGTKVE